MENEEKQIRAELSRSYLSIAKADSLMFENIDSFVALSRDNTRVRKVGLYPFFDSEPGNYEFGDKVGEIVGNLMELKEIFIHFLLYTVDDYDGNEAHMPDWETQIRILRYLRRKILLCSVEYDAEVEDIQGLARAIHGHSMISGFSFLGFTFANMGSWCSALATLPCLQSVRFGLSGPETDDQRILVTNLEL